MSLLSLLLILGIEKTYTSKASLVSSFFIFKSILDDIDEEIQDIINRSSLKHYEDEMKAYRSVNKSLVDLSKNNHVNNTITSAMDRLIEGNGNITKSLGVVYNGENIKLNNFYKKSLNQAAFQVASGAFSRQQVVRNLVNNLSDSGIRVINYQNSGRNYTVESASKMLVRTTLNQITSDISLMNAEDMGQDLMEISAHAGARPSHAEWQGQIVSLSGDNDKYLSLDDIGYGEVTGFMGANCRHNWYPFFEGVSERNWTKEMLDDIDPEPFEFEGKEYTFYEATQKQRQIERTIRKYKHRVMMYDKVGDKESKLIAQVRLQRQRQLYKDFNKAGKLRPTSVNTHVYGYNKSKASQEVWATKKAQKKANEIYNLGSDKLNLDIYLKDEKLRKAIRSDYNLTINPGRQDKHIQGTNNYNQELKQGRYKSYLLKDVDPQDLINKYAGTGIFQRSRKGKWKNKELISGDEFIGVNIDNITNELKYTNKFYIHYSKKEGTHIVPTLKGDKKWI